MRRLTISMDDDLGDAFEALTLEQGYQSRSEAVRDLIREAVEARRLNDVTGDRAVASLSYVYDHHTRSLAQRLTELQHEHHELVVATMHIHLDQASCLEAVTLRGPVEKIRSLADAMQAERGVRFTKLNLVTLGPGGGHGHSHGDDHPHSHEPHGHASQRPG